MHVLNHLSIQTRVVTGEPIAVTGTGYAVTDQAGPLRNAVGDAAPKERSALRSREQCAISSGAPRKSVAADLQTNSRQVRAKSRFQSRKIQFPDLTTTATKRP